MLLLLKMKTIRVHEFKKVSVNMNQKNMKTKYKGDSFILIETIRL